MGLSEALAPDLRRAAAVHPISSLQSEYSLLERGVESEVLGACEELGIGFLPFSPLLRGLLAGSLTADSQLDEGDFRSGDRFPRVGPEHRSANARLVEVVEEIAARAQLHACARWRWPGCSAAAPWIVPIPGTKRAAYVEDNAGAPAHADRRGPESDSTHWRWKSQGKRYGGGAPTPDWVSPPLP